MLMQDTMLDKARIMNSVIAFILICFLHTIYITAIMIITDALGIWK